MPVSRLSAGREVARLPRVEIPLWGGETCEAMYRSFTSRHARFPLVQRKAWGIALLPLTDTFETYFSDPERSLLRRKARRAEKKGYRYDRFLARSRLDELLAINASAPERQGRAMDDAYLDADAFASSLDRCPEFRGVFDREGTLVAYAEVPVCGDLFLLSRLLGHEEHLDEGVMYLLIGEVVREMTARREGTGHPAWGMYDTMVGAGPGLRFFKERLGFRSYNVRWVWRAPEPA